MDSMVLFILKEAAARVRHVGMSFCVRFIMAMPRRLPNRALEAQIVKFGNGK